MDKNYIIVCFLWMLDSLTINVVENLYFVL